LLIFNIGCAQSPSNSSAVDLQTLSKSEKRQPLPPAYEKIDDMMQAYVSLYQFNGTVLVYEKGKIILHKGYGLKNATDSEANDRNTIFQLGSVTKQFTAAVILKLEAQGKLKLSDKINNYFPTLAHSDKITIEHLLTHTSGIYNYTNDSKFMNGEAVKPASKEKIINLFKDKPLDFEPDTKFSYSNSGYSLLGYIIEDVSGKKYEQVVRELILQPLKMNHSGFDFVGLKDKDKATGYLTYNEKLKLPAVLVDSSVSFSAGSMYSTARDLLIWHKSLMKNEVLNAAEQDRAYTPYKSNYGYGWLIDSIFGKRRIAHGGGIFGFLSSFVRVPQNDLCIVLLCNSNSARLESIHPKILAILLEQPYELPRERKEIEVPESVLKQYEGEYELAADRKLIVTLENGRLMLQSTGQPKRQAFAESENSFFLKAADVQIEFKKGADGKVNQIVWHQGGKITPGKKIR